ncbi:MAG: hypothetical protein ACYCPW_08725 [Nitrososphaerales archaeon]
MNLLQALFGKQTIEDLKQYSDEKYAAEADEVYRRKRERLRNTLLRRCWWKRSTKLLPPKERGEKETCC